MSPLVKAALEANAQGERFRLPPGTVVEGDFALTPKNDLANATLIGVEFRDVNFQGLRLEESNFSEARFTRCTLTGSFDDSVFTQATFMECALTGSFTDCDFSHSESLACNYSQGLFDGSNFYHSRVEFGRSGSGFPSFVGCKFVEATFAFCQFRGGEFAMSDFTGAILRNSDVSGGEFSRCEFDAFTMYAVTAVDASFLKARFAGASLRGVDLTRAFLTSTHMRNVDLIACILLDANRVDSDWDHVNI